MEHYPLRSTLGTLGSSLTEAERLRHAAKQARLLAWFLIILSWAPTAVIPVLGEDMFGKTVDVWLVCSAVLSLIASILIYMFVMANRRDEYVRYFKNHILTPVIARCLPGVALYENGGISSQTFNDSQLFGSNYNIFKSADLLQGMVSGMEMSCSTLLVQRKTTSYRNGKRRTNTTTLFSGIFMQLRLPDPVHTEIYLYPDTAERLLGALGTKLQSTVGEYFAGKGELAHTGDPEFEKHFVVYSPYPFKATEILTDERRKLLSEMAGSAGNVRMCIRHDKLYLALPCGRAWAEPDLDHPADEEAQLTDILSHPGRLYRLASTFAIS